MSDKNNSMYSIESLETSLVNNYEKLDMCIEKFKSIKPSFDDCHKRNVSHEILSIIAEILTAEQLICALKNYVNLVEK